MSNTNKVDTDGITQKDLRDYHNNKVAPFIGQDNSNSGHIIEDEAGTKVTKRNGLVINSPLTVEDDRENEKTVIGADTSGALDLSKIIPPGIAGNVDGHIYSTDEIMIGKWIDGRNVYEKTVEYDSATYTDSSSRRLFVLGTINNVDKLIASDIVYRINDLGNYLSGSTMSPELVPQYCPFCALDSNNTLAIQLEINSLVILRVTGWFTVRYTKTTDTV